MIASFAISNSLRYSRPDFLRASSALRRSMAVASTLATARTKFTSSSVNFLRWMEWVSRTPKGSFLPWMTTYMPLTIPLFGKIRFLVNRVSRSRFSKITGSPETRARPTCEFSSASMVTSPTSSGSQPAPACNRSRLSGSRFKTPAYSVSRFREIMLTASSMRGARSVRSSARCPSWATSACWSAR